MPVTKNTASQTTRFIFIPFHAGFDRSVAAPMAFCQPRFAPYKIIGGTPLSVACIGNELANPRALALPKHSSTRLHTALLIDRRSFG